MSRKPEARQARMRLSCDACFMAKVRCSKGQPACQRCLSCGHVCHYSPSTRAGKPRSSRLGQSSPQNTSAQSHMLLNQGLPFPLGQSLHLSPGPQQPQPQQPQSQQPQSQQPQPQQMYEAPFMQNYQHQPQANALSFQANQGSQLPLPNQSYLSGSVWENLPSVGPMNHGVYPRYTNGNTDVAYPNASLEAMDFQPQDHLLGGPASMGFSWENNQVTDPSRFAFFQEHSSQDTPTSGLSSSVAPITPETDTHITPSSQTKELTSTDDDDCLCFKACTEALRSMPERISGIEHATALRHTTIVHCATLIACPRCLRKHGRVSVFLLSLAIMRKLASFQDHSNGNNDIIGGHSHNDAPRDVSQGNDNHRDKTKESQKIVKAVSPGDATSPDPLIKRILPKHEVHLYQELFTKVNNLSSNENGCQDS